MLHLKNDNKMRPYDKENKGNQNQIPTYERRLLDEKDQGCMEIRKVRKIE